MVTHSAASEYELTAPTSGSMVSRAMILFVNFFLIIFAYYHIKPASRSLFIEYIGADYLPYVWIGTAVVLGSLIGYYHRLVERYRRLLVVLGTCLTFAALLLLFRLWLAPVRLLPLSFMSWLISLAWCWSNNSGA
jgi:AAA family ATP:ADP antiporter